MSRKVVISKTAEKKLDNLFDSLIQKWSVTAKKEFVEKLDSLIEIIKSQPEIFPESKKSKGLRKWVMEFGEYFI